MTRASVVCDRSGGSETRTCDANRPKQSLNSTKLQDYCTVLVPYTPDVTRLPPGLSVTADEIRSHGYMVRLFASEGRWLVEARDAPVITNGEARLVPLTSWGSNGASSC